MEVHLSISELGSNNWTTIVEGISFLQGKRLEKSEVDSLSCATWRKGVESMMEHLSKMIRKKTGNVWDLKEIVPITAFGETLDLPDC